MQQMVSRTSRVQGVVLIENTDWFVESRGPSARGNVSPDIGGELKTGRATAFCYKAFDSSPRDVTLD